MILVDTCLYSLRGGNGENQTRCKTCRVRDPRLYYDVLHSILYTRVQRETTVQQNRRYGGTALQGWVGGYNAL